MMMIEYSMNSWQSQLYVNSWDLRNQEATEFKCHRKLAKLHTCNTTASYIHTSINFMMGNTLVQCVLVKTSILLLLHEEDKLCYTNNFIASYILEECHGGIATMIFMIVFRVKVYVANTNIASYSVQNCMIMVTERSVCDTCWLITTFSGLTTSLSWWSYSNTCCLVTQCTTCLSSGLYIHR